MSRVFVRNVAELEATAHQLATAIEVGSDNLAQARALKSRIGDEWSAKIDHLTSILVRLDPDDPERSHIEGQLEVARSERSGIEQVTGELLRTAQNRFDSAREACNRTIQTVGKMSGHFVTMPGIGTGITTSPVHKSGGHASLGSVRPSTVSTDPPAIHFGKASRQDYEWMVLRFDDTIRPGVAAGMTRAQFVEMDGDNPAKNRALAQVYDQMYHADSCIKLSSDGKGGYEADNGNHRITVARELGVASLPARFL